MKKRKILLGIVILFALAYIYYGYGINPYFVRSKIKETTPLRFSDKPEVLYYDYSFIFDSFDAILKLSDKDYEYCKNLKNNSEKWSVFPVREEPFTHFHIDVENKLANLGTMATDSVTYISLQIIRSPAKSYGSSIHLAKNNIIVVSYSRTSYY